MEAPTPNTVLLAVIAVFQAIKTVVDYFQKKAANRVADKLEKTGAETNKAIAVVSRRTDEIHTLVNSDWGKLLRAHALMARSSAALVASNPASTAEQISIANRVAESAEQDSRVHDSKQATVDIRNAAERMPNGSVPEEEG